MVAASIQSCAILVITNMIRRACQTAACPVRERRGASSVGVLYSAGMLTCRRFSANGPDLSSAHLDFDSVQRSWRRPVKHIARGRIERSFMTRAFQALMIAREI